MMDCGKKGGRSARFCLSNKLFSLPLSISLLTTAHLSIKGASASNETITSTTTSTIGATISSAANAVSADVSSGADKFSIDTAATTAGETKPRRGKEAARDQVAMIGGAECADATDTKTANATAAIPAPESAPVFIDNDQAVETRSSFEYKDLEIDATGTKAKIGATFPVVFLSEVTSRSARSGEPFEARLKYDLKIGERMIAEKGSPVVGHINYALKARSGIGALVSPERWYKNSGCIGLTFDEIVTTKGDHIPLVAVPARKAIIIRNKADGRELGVNSEGMVTGPWAQQMKYKLIKFGISTAMMPAGTVSFGAAPVVMGVLGAANPSFALMKPVGENVRHRRVKGFFWGAVSGMPGGWVVEELIVRGQETIIKPGDEFLVAFKEEFSGEPGVASQAQGTSAKVRGEVISKRKSKRSAVVPRVQS
jgi:hypothetical protein